MITLERSNMKLNYSLCSFNRLICMLLMNPMINSPLSPLFAFEKRSLLAKGLGLHFMQSSEKK